MSFNLTHNYLLSTTDARLSEIDKTQASIISLKPPFLVFLKAIFINAPEKNKQVRYLRNEFIIP